MRKLRSNLFNLTMALFLTVFLTAPGPAHGQTPNFSNVTDILQGRRNLLPIDDLAISWVSSDWAMSSLLTENGVLQAPTSLSLIGVANVNTYSLMGRMFALDHAVTVTANASFYSITDGATELARGFVPSTIPMTAAAMGDFDEDGYQDIAFANGTILTIATAKDLNDPSQGFDTTATAITNLPSGTGFRNFTVGDFNGDGQVELAGVTSTYNGGAGIFIWEIEDLRPVEKSMTFVQPSSGITSSNPMIVAGQFIPVAVIPENPNPIDDLILIWGGDAASPMELICIDVPPNFVIAPGATCGGEPAISGQGQFMNAVTAPLSLFGYFLTDNGPLVQSDQLVIVSQLNDMTLSFFITTIAFPGGTLGSGPPEMESGTTSTASPNLFCGPQQQSATTANSVYDVAVGNFDQDVTKVQPFLQAAFVFESQCANGTVARSVAAWDLEKDGGPNSTGPPLNFAASPSSSQSVENPDGSITAMSIAAGDTQGRSLLLGEPDVVRVTAHSQPQVVLGLPPMHVDWALPVNSSEAEVLNVSGIPDSFFSQYETEIKGENQSSQKGTTSYAYSTKETAGASVTFGVPDVDDVKVSYTEALKQAHTNFVAKQFNTYTGTDFDASTQTGFSDQLWYTQKRFNVYNYPVLGPVVCPNETPNCSDDQKVPLAIQFSGPDMISQINVQAANVEWYQPLHEPGNVFSYPRDLATLQAEHPDFSPLTTENPTILFTDMSTTTEQANWSQGQGQNQSTGSTQTHSFSNNTSVSAKVTFEGAGGSGSASFGYSQSKSLGSLNTTINTVSGSTGIGIDKPGTFLSPSDYQYAFQPFIFGQGNPAGTIQDIPLSTQIMTTGLLWAAFTADPTQPPSGAWWEGTYTTPDVALNHPMRWSISNPISDSPPSNCLPISVEDERVDCADFNSADPKDLWLSQFYFMRGLLISPADENGDPVGGPQMTVATAGQKLALQARVYNYSLVDMSAPGLTHPAATVKVQFYGQEWDHTTNQPVGNSFLIGEDTLDPLSGFGTTSSAGNWTFASTTFDTTSYGDTYLTFWVVVWMEDSSGALVPEMADHGLTAKPGALTSIGDVPIEAHSNNVGFYHSVFYVFTPESAAATAPDADGSGGLTVESTSISPNQVVPHEKVEVRVLLNNAGASVDGVQVLFYDANPLTGGKIFDVEFIPHIRADDRYEVRIPFRPRRCGAQTIFALVRAGSSTPSLGNAEVDVACLSQTAIHAMSRVSLGKDSQIASGNVISGANSGRVTVGMGGKTAGDYSVIADRVAVKKDADVASDVRFNRLENKGLISGKQTPVAELPVFPELPGFQAAAAGTEKIVVSKNETRVLAPGDYHKIVLRKGARLFFSGGIYNVLSIKAQKGASLIFEAASQVRVAKNFKTGRDTYVGPSDASTITAADIVFYIAGKKAQLGRASIARANFYAPDGRIYFKGSEATGGFIGSEVKIGKESAIHVESFVRD